MNRRLDLEDSAGNQFAEMRGPIFRPTTFTLYQQGMETGRSRSGGAASAGRCSPTLIRSGSRWTPAGWAGTGGSRGRPGEASTRCRSPDFSPGFVEVQTGDLSLRGWPGLPTFCRDAGYVLPSGLQACMVARTVSTPGLAPTTLTMATSRPCASRANASRAPSAGPK